MAEGSSTHNTLFDVIITSSYNTIFTVLVSATSTHNTKFIIQTDDSSTIYTRFTIEWSNTATRRGSIELASGVQKKITNSRALKRGVNIHVTSGDVYIAPTSGTLDTLTNGFLIPTGIQFRIKTSEDLWARTDNTGVVVYVYDENK